MRLIRFQDGIVTETGKVVAMFTKGQWYEPRPNRVASVDWEPCLPDKAASYEALPITAERREVIVESR